MLNSVYDEIKELSKKKQDETLNKLKVRMINRILEQVKDILGEESTNQFIDLLDDETLPTNSDAVLVLGQFQAAMVQFKNKYSSYGKWITK